MPDGTCKSHRARADSSFFPSILERRRRIDQALYVIVIGPEVHEVSTRKVVDLVEALAIDAGILKYEWR